MKSNEKNFIERLKLGKEDALEFVVDQYLPLMKGITYKVLSAFKNDGLIEECINDIFISIWNNADKFHGEASEDFRKWICAIAKFKAIDYYRKAMGNAEVASDDIEVDTHTTIEDELIIQEDRRELIRLINNLEPIDKEIFLMKYFLGYKSEDIAQKLKTTKASIDNRIYRGKKKLQQKVINLNAGGHAL